MLPQAIAALLDDFMWPSKIGSLAQNGNWAVLSATYTFTQIFSLSENFEVPQNHVHNGWA